MNETETVKEYFDKLLRIINQAQEQRRLIRFEGFVERALAAKASSNYGVKENNLKNVAQVANKEEEQLFVATCFAISNSSEKWLIDNGCTNHMTFDCDLFKEFDTSVVSKAKIGNGEHIAVKGKDTVAIESISDTKLIKDVLFVPNINQNLLSVGQLIQKGFKVIFESDQCLIKDANDNKVFKVKMKGKNFMLDPIKEEQTTFSATNVHIEVWHKRLGHFNHTTVVNL
ncbi:hypothetical protein CR513_61430, partial [Mucuna pruriens]